jgi:hypothetical protein
MALALGNPMQAGKLEHEDEQPMELITGALHDARELAVAEVDKLKAEAITQVKGVGETVKVVSIGALILTVATVMLGTALALGLVEVGLPAWAGFALTGAILLVAGVVVIKKRPTAAK